MMVVSAVLAPSATVTTGNGGNERTLIGSQGGGAGWHDKGSVYLLTGSNETWREASADSYFDVTKLDNGRIIAGFMSGGYTDCGPYASPCARTGFRVIDPTPTPRVVNEYSFPVRSKKNSEVHAVERLPTGEFLLTDMDAERIFTVKNGEITWQWNANSRYESPADPTRTDWLHINDVDVIGDGRFLVSVRNANQLVIVERGSGVVEVINRDEAGSDDTSCQGGGELVDADADGDVRCGDPGVLNHQHNPQWLGEGAILIADSENDRVVELQRTSDGTWEPTWTLSNAGGIRFDWPRDADRLPNGNTLITDTLNKRIVEVNESGAVVWSRRTDRIPYEADRLPAGESMEAPRYDVTETGTNDVDSDVPVLSTLLVGVQAIVPALPYWFGELQLFLTLVSLGLVLGGIGYWVRT